MSLYLGFLFFSISFVLHLFIWKIRIPKKQTNSLLLIFFGVLLIACFYLILSNFSIIELFRIIILFTSLTLGYLITYTALEADSPSLVFIKSIADAGSKGLSKIHFDHIMTDELLVEPRVKDLVRDKYVIQNSDKYVLTAGGKRFVSVFIRYRKLLNASKGG